MKKIIIYVLAIVLVFAMAAPCFAQDGQELQSDTATAERSTVSSETTVSAEPQLELNVTGAVMWGIIGVAIVLILVYMAYNIIRTRREIRVELAKPTLIISSGYTRHIDK